MINWLTAHYKDIFAIVGQVVLVASAIVKLTPSQEDDAFLAKVVAVLEHFSVFEKQE